MTPRHHHSESCSKDSAMRKKRFASFWKLSTPTQKGRRESDTNKLMWLWHETFDPDKRGRERVWESEKKSSIPNDAWMAIHGHRGIKLLATACLELKQAAGGVFFLFLFSLFAVQRTKRGKLIKFILDDAIKVRRIYGSLGRHWQSSCRTTLPLNDETELQTENAPPETLISNSEVRRKLFLVHPVCEQKEKNFPLQKAFIEVD